MLQYHHLPTSYGSNFCSLDLLFALHSSGEQLSVTQSWLLDIQAHLCSFWFFCRRCQFLSLVGRRHTLIDCTKRNAKIFFPCPNKFAVLNCISSMSKAFIFCMLLQKKATLQQATIGAKYLENFGFLTRRAEILTPNLCPVTVSSGQPQGLGALLLVPSQSSPGVLKGWRG